MPADDNFKQAIKDLDLNRQERTLYQRHLFNLWGPGGVNNPDGSRSTLYQAVQEHNGKYYNIPTVWNGKREVEKWTRPSDGKVFDVPNKKALANVEKEGWDKFPAYDDPNTADKRYEQMHNYMEKDTGAFFDVMSPRVELNPPNQKMATLVQDPRYGSNDINELISERGNEGQGTNTRKPDINELDNYYNGPQQERFDKPYLFDGKDHNPSTAPPTGAEKREPLPSQFYPPTPGDNEEYPARYNLNIDYNLG
jgi:hypothetical protein